MKLKARQQAKVVMQKIPLKDIKNNTVVEVGIDEVPSMVASGHYAMAKGQQMPILNPEGELGDIDASEYMQALQGGYAPATTADIAKHVDIANFGDSPLQTGLERAASAATFGATDFIASKLEPAYAENMRKREELNPVAAVVGEIAGVVGPALVSGGSSLAAKAVSAPIRAAEAVSAATAKAVAKALPSTGMAAKIVADVIPRAAGMGVEGALYGAGNYVSDASLGNADWSAESLLSNVGMSGMLGAGLGAGLGIGKLAAAPIMQKVKGWNDVNKLAEQVTGLQTVKGQKLAGELSEGELAKYVVNDINGGSIKPFNSENLAEKAAATLDNHNSQLDDLLVSISDEANAVGALPSKLEISQKIEVKINNLLSEIKVAGKEAPVVGEYAANLKNELKKWKRFLGTLPKEVDDVAAKEASALAAGAPEGFLAETATKASIKDETKALLEKAGKERISVEDLNTLRKQIGAAAKYDKMGDPSKNIYAEINNKLYGVMRGIVDDVASKVGSGEELRELNRKIWLGIKLEPFMDKVALQAEKSNIFNMRDMIAGAAAGAGGPIGYAVAAGRAIQKISENKMVKSAQLIYGVKAAERKLDKAVNDSLRSFFLDAGRGVKASTLKLSTDAKEYDAYTSKVQEYANNPDAFLNHVNKRHIGVSRELPTVVASAEAKGLQAMQFLATKMPKQQTLAGMIPRKYIPSTQQRAKFMRYAEIVEDPKRALQHFQSGNLSREHVETLQAIYPELYKKMQSSVAEYTTLHGQKLPYGKKLQLGLLMGVPTDVSMTPEFVQRMQSGFAQTPDDGGLQPAVQPGVTGLSKLNNAGRLAGETGE